MERRSQPRPGAGRARQRRPPACGGAGGVCFGVSEQTLRASGTQTWPIDAAAPQGTPSSRTDGAGGAWRNGNGVYTSGAAHDIHGRIAVRATRGPDRPDHRPTYTRLARPRPSGGPLRPGQAGAYSAELRLNLACSVRRRLTAGRPERVWKRRLQQPCEQPDGRTDRGVVRGRPLPHRLVPDTANDPSAILSPGARLGIDLPLLVKAASPHYEPHPREAPRGARTDARHNTWLWPRSTASTREQVRQRRPSASAASPPPRTRDLPPGSTRIATTANPLADLVGGRVAADCARARSTLVNAPCHMPNPDPLTNRPLGSIPP